MSSFASHARSYEDFNKPILPVIRTTDTEGATYKYESRGGSGKRVRQRSNKNRRTKRRASKNNKTRKSYFYKK